MSSPLRSPKALTDWLELDYFNRPRRLRWYRRFTTWGVFLAALAAAVLIWLWARPEIYQAGSVSQAHAMFNHDCRVCHTEPLQTAKRLWPASADFHSVADTACQTCHEGPAHRPDVPASGCAGCHREHRGQRFLAQVPDSHCTTCHAHLEEHSGGPPSVENVRGFAGAGDHPEFRLWRGPEPVDPSRVRFNHAVHLQEEGVAMPGGRRKTLACASCHQLAADRRYMQPIQYYAHCADCHPLSIMVVGSNDPNARSFSREAAPHDRPGIVRAVVRERFRDYFRQHHPSEIVQEIKRPFPGKLPRAPRAATEEEWVESQYQLAERMLFSAGGSCRYCHLEAGASWRPGALPQYAGTKIPPRWYEKSRFSHDRHRFIRCDECHSGATESTQARNVLMPRIGVCQNCHNAQVGARYDCSECHKYHDRDPHLPEKGTRTIQDCLRMR